MARISVVMATCQGERYLTEMLDRPHTRGFLLEVCIASLDDALAAREGGAERLELNSALELGGLTPSAGTMFAVSQSVDLPVIAMIRPRAGGFCYTPALFRSMCADIERALAHGAKGVAIGLLEIDNRVDLERLRVVRSMTGDADRFLNASGADAYIAKPLQDIEGFIVWLSLTVEEFRARAAAMKEPVGAA